MIMVVNIRKSILNRAFFFIFKKLKKYAKLLIVNHWYV